MKFSIPYDNTFDIRSTLECGQVFRYYENNGIFTVIAGKKRCQISQNDEGCIFCCEDEYFFKKYFDLNRNYAIIHSNVQDKGLVSSAIEYGKGIHILNQDHIEVIFSFIISANNHIPRIKAIIERLCDSLGEDMGDYFAFPTLEALSLQDEAFYKSIGAGYRADYIAQTARMLQIVNFDELNKLSTEQIRRELMAFKGIGRKVADCILLFAFHRTDVFPVDTWILKVFRPEYGNIPADKLSKLLVEKYGENSGYVQQWLFYQKRSAAKMLNTKGE
ncbi:MAG: DNA glycosylase [Clostridia bacterium]|nr:DNA glycosylase [Clostridia bacterium]